VAQLRVQPVRDRAIGLAQLALFHLDPLVNNRVMAAHRLGVYHDLANHFSSNGLNCAIYGRTEFLKHLEQKGPRRYRLIECGLEPFNFVRDGDYQASAYTNSLSDELTEKLRAEYLRLSIDPEFIVTNTPSAGLRLAWPEHLILHYELGVFNRPPFPVYHQTDPWGFYHKSALSAFPLLNVDVNERWIKSVTKLREQLLQRLGVSAADVGSKNCIYFPLQSADSWPVRLENPTYDRISSVRKLREAYPDKTIVVNEKPQSPLTTSERAIIAAIDGVEVIDNADDFGDGSKHVLISKATATSSPSLSLQTIFWGNRLCVPHGCSMQTWGSNPSFENLAAYMALFNFNDPQGLLKRIGLYKQFWRDRAFIPRI